jgi:hypothetical protein
VRRTLRALAEEYPVGKRGGMRHAVHMVRGLPVVERARHAVPLLEAPGDSVFAGAVVRRHIYRRRWKIFSDIRASVFRFKTKTLGT